MASPLGFHAEVLTPPAIALIQLARPALVVTLDLDRGRLQQLRPFVGMLVGRYDPNGDSQNRYIGAGTALGHFIAGGVAPVADLLDAVTVLNEPETWTEAEALGPSPVAATAARVAGTLVDACAVLRAAGLTTVVGNFSVGTPRLPGDDGGRVLDALLPGVAAGDYYGGHEYSFPTMGAGYGYRLGRTAAILDYYAGKGLRRRAILTEYGLDFAHPGLPSGYAANGVTDDAYLADLQWASARLAADPRILGAAVFEVGSYDRFASFDLLRTALGDRYAAWLAAQAGSAPPPARATPPSPATAEGAPMPATNPGAIVTQDEGPSNLCWDVSAGECAVAAGGRSDVDAMYRAVKGVDYVAPGQPATFAELIHAVTWVAGYNGWQVQWYGADGRVNDFATFRAVVGAGDHYVIAGIRGQALGLGDFGHFEAVMGLYTAPDGTTMIRVADSYAAYDHAGWQPSYPLPAYLAAMGANWDPDADALAWRFVLPAASSPAAAAPVAAPVPDAAAVPADEQAAYAYYTQTKIGVDRAHALWTACLLPLYRRAQQLKAANDPLADLVMPGPLAGAETGARWGGTRPAAIVRLTNQTVGVYQAPDGTWHAYRPEAT